MTKTCTKCMGTKSLDEFSPMRRGKFGRASRCKACVAVLNAEWKRRNPEKMRAYRRAYNRKLKRQQWAVLDVLKRLVGCRDCGRADGVLHFDHRPGEDKGFTVAGGLGTSWKSLWAEVDKCDIRCPSCHWHRHAAAGDIYLLPPLAR